MKCLTKYPSIILVLLMLISSFASCAVPDNPSPSYQQNKQDVTSNSTSPYDADETTAEITETEEVIEKITNYPIPTDAEKVFQRDLFYHNKERPVRAWDLAGTAKECPYTSEEILSNISLGDELLSLYEKIGYPTYRDTLNTFHSGVPVDIYSMIYTTSDGDKIIISVELAGCSTGDYRYVVEYYRSIKKDESHLMDLEAKIQFGIIPVFMAVEQVGVDYLLEKEIITPYEATLYEAEEAVYQERLARQEVTE